MMSAARCEIFRLKSSGLLLAGSSNSAQSEFCVVCASLGGSHVLGPKHKMFTENHMQGHLRIFHADLQG